MTEASSKESWDFDASNRPTSGIRDYVLEKMKGISLQRYRHALANLPDSSLDNVWGE
jgi:hypothetical protein